MKAKFIFIYCIFWHLTTIIVFGQTNSGWTVTIHGGVGGGSIQSYGTNSSSSYTPTQTSSSGRSNWEPYGYVDGKAYWTQSGYYHAERESRTVRGYTYDTKKEADEVRLAIREGRIYKNIIYETRARADAARARDIEEARKREEERIQAENIENVKKKAEYNSRNLGHSFTSLSLPKQNYTVGAIGYNSAVAIPEHTVGTLRYSSVVTIPEHTVGALGYSSFATNDDVESYVQERPSRPPATINYTTEKSEIEDEASYIESISIIAKSLIGIAGLGAAIVAIPTVNIWKENYKAFCDWQNYGTIPSTGDILYNALFQDEVAEELLKTMAGGLIRMGVLKGGEKFLIKNAEKFGVEPIFAHTLIKSDLGGLSKKTRAIVKGWEIGEKLAPHIQQGNNENN